MFEIRSSITNLVTHVPIPLNFNPKMTLHGWIYHYQGDFSTPRNISDLSIHIHSRQISRKKKKVRVNQFQNLIRIFWRIGNSHSSPCQLIHHLSSNNWRVGRFIGSSWQLPNGFARRNAPGWLSCWSLQWAFNLWSNVNYPKSRRCDDLKSIQITAPKKES